MRLARLTWPTLLDRGLHLGIDWDAYILPGGGVDDRRMLADHPKGERRKVVDEYRRREQGKAALP
jgi:hypothetical protein